MAGKAPRPGKPKAPTAPGAPKAAGRSKHQSKTGDPRCSQAASRWQKAVKSGQAVPKDVALQLAACRNRNRRANQKEERSARAAYVSHLRQTGQRDKALALSRERRGLEKQRGEAAAMLRALRAGRGGRERARVARGNLSGNQTTRGKEILQAMEATVPRSTLYHARIRAGRHAPAEGTGEARRRQPRQAQPAPAPARRPIMRTSMQQLEQNNRVQDPTRGRVAAALRAMRKTGSREMARSYSQQLHRSSVTRGPGERLQPSNAQERLLMTLRENDRQVNEALRAEIGGKIARVSDRVQRRVTPTPAERSQRRAGLLPLARQQRSRNAAYRALGMNRGNVDRSMINPNNTQHLQTMRAATSMGRVGTRQGRDTYQAMVQQARSTPTPAPAPAPAPRRRRAAAAPAPAPAAAPTRRSSGGLRRTLPASVQQARDQMGNVSNDYYRNSPGSRVVKEQVVSRAESDFGLMLAGNTTEEKYGHLLAISGMPAQNAGSINVSVSSNGIVIQATGRDGSSMQRTIKRDSYGEPYVYNAYYVPGNAGRADGTAIDHYNRSILAARAAGIKRIKVSGAGSGQGNVDTSNQSWTGYHTWVEYGFNGPLSSLEQGIFRRAHPDLANVQDFNSALFHRNPEAARAARDAWRREGTGTHNITLEIGDLNSSSMKAYQKVFKKRRNQEFTASNINQVHTKSGNYDAYY